MIYIRRMLLLMALLAGAMLSACMQGGIIKFGETGGDQAPAVPQVTKVADTRATITWPLVSNADGYQISVDNAGFFTISPDPCAAGTCTYTMCGLGINGTHDIKVRAFKGNKASDPVTLMIDTTLTAARFVPSSSTNENPHFGAIIVRGNINGDENPDLAVGGFYDAAVATYGQVDIFFTGPDLIGADNSISVSKAVYGTYREPHGAAIGMGRVTGSDRDDVLIGQYTDSSNYGKIFIFKAATLNSGSSFNSVTQSDYTIMSTFGPDFADAEFGKSIAIADLDGDGCDDIQTGAPFWINDPVSGDFRRGKAYLFDGCISADIFTPAGSEFYTGTVGEARAGSDAWNVGDIDGDGTDEILYSMLAASGPPATVTLGFGVDIWKTFDHSALSRMMAFRLGDIYADGVDNFAVRFETQDAFANMGGVVYIFKGSAVMGSIPEYAIFDDLDRGFGTGVAFGDIDDDGAGELIIGSYSKISIYEGPDFDDGVDSTMPYGCANAIIMDANADSCLDMVCGDVMYGDQEQGSLLILH